MECFYGIGFQWVRISAKEVLWISCICILRSWWTFSVLVGVHFPNAYLLNINSFSLILRINGTCITTYLQKHDPVGYTNNYCGFVRSICFRCKAFPKLALRTPVCFLVFSLLIVNNFFVWFENYWPIRIYFATKINFNILSFFNFAFVLIYVSSLKLQVQYMEKNFFQNQIKFFVFLSLLSLIKTNHDQCMKAAEIKLITETRNFELNVSKPESRKVI